MKRKRLRKRKDFPKPELILSKGGAKLQPGLMQVSTSKRNDEQELKEAANADTRVAALHRFSPLFFKKVEYVPDANPLDMK